MFIIMSAATVSAQDQKSHLLASPYCLGYQVLHGEEEPDHYIVIIDWSSTVEHLNGFRKSADFMPFFNLVKPFYNDLQEMKHYQKVVVPAKK